MQRYNICLTLTSISGEIYPYADRFRPKVLLRLDVIGVREDVQPTDITELHDLVLEEAAVLVGKVQGRAVLDLERVHVVCADGYIRVLAT